MFRKNNNIIMATAIRQIPTLFGEEAQRFLRKAEMVESEPGTVRYPASEIKAFEQILKEANML